jgi:hypothetical protein
MKKIILFVLLSVWINAFAQQKERTAAMHLFTVNLHEDFGVSKDPDLYDAIYEALRNEINSSTNIEFFSKDTLHNYVNYNNLEYPVGTPKRAAKSKIAQNYYTIFVTVYPSGFIKGGSNVISSGGLGAGKHKSQSKVMVRIELIAYDATGKKLKKIVEEAVTTERIEFEHTIIKVGGIEMNSFDKSILSNPQFSQVLSEVSKKTAEALK